MGRLAGAARLGVAAGAVAPFVLLAAFAWIGSRPASTAVEDGRFPIQRRPVAAARAALETTRLRNLAEAHRFATGSWPADPGELVQLGWLPSEALAGSGSGPYHYAEVEGGVVVLAPER